MIVVVHNISSTENPSESGSALSKFWCSCMTVFMNENVLVVGADGHNDSVIKCVLCVEFCCRDYTCGKCECEDANLN